MKLTVVPILERALALYAEPRGMERFQSYLRLMLKEDRSDVDLLPMVAMNPMAREHVPREIERLLALGAERIVAEACREAERRLADVDVALKVGISVVDDVGGGWSQREDIEAKGLFDSGPGLKRGWIGVTAWARTPATPSWLREETLRAAFAAVHTLRHGPARTLGDVMDREGRADAFAGRRPSLAPEALAAARRVLGPLRGTPLKDHPTCFAAMFGDRAAREMGHKPLGLPERAGFQVGLADALSA